MLPSSIELYNPTHVRISQKVKPFSPQKMECIQSGDESFSMVYKEYVDVANEIVTTRARINLLRQSRIGVFQQYKKEKQVKAMAEAVRERRSNQARRQQMIAEERKRQFEEMQSRAKQIKTAMKSHRQSTRTQLVQQKMRAATEERNLSLQLNRQILKEKEEDYAAKQLMAKKVRQDEELIASRLKEFEKSREEQARINYRSRISRSLYQKMQAARELQQLRQQEKKLLVSPLHLPKTSPRTLQHSFRPSTNDPEADYFSIQHKHRLNATMIAN